MSKSIATITQSASLAARAIARLEATASAVHTEETAKRERSLQMVSDPSGFSAIIKHGRTIIELQGDSFAVTKVEAA